MSKTYKKVTVSYPVEDFVTAELYFEVDDKVDEKELQRIVEHSDLENFDGHEGIDFHGTEIVDRDYACDTVEGWEKRIGINEIEDISDEEWGEYYVA